MIYFLLFCEFFQTGLFSIGGGLATLPFLKSIAERYPWFTFQNLTDMIAISESTPGPIGVNMSTYAGYQAANVPGALVATLSLVLPSVMIILAISHFLEKFNSSRLVKNAFYGLRPATAGLIAGAMLEVFTLSFLHLDAFQLSGNIADLFNVPAVLLFLVLFLAIRKWDKLHPAIFIFIGAVVGIFMQY